MITFLHCYPFMLAPHSLFDSKDKAQKKEAKNNSCLIKKPLCQKLVAMLSISGLTTWIHADLCEY